MTDAEIRARNAQQLLENPLLQEALGQVQQEAIEAWMATKAGAVEDRERHWMMVKCAQRLREVLQGAVDNGQFEARRASRAPMP